MKSLTKALTHHWRQEGQRGGGSPDCKDRGEPSRWKESFLTSWPLWPISCLNTLTITLLGPNYNNAVITRFESGGSMVWHNSISSMGDWPKPTQSCEISSHTYILEETHLNSGWMLKSNLLTKKEVFQGSVYINHKYIPNFLINPVIFDKHLFLGIQCNMFTSDH